VSVIESGCEVVGVGRDGRGAGARERADDVDALTGAGEENRGHRVRG
jgi:hypothetical protein